MSTRVTPTPTCAQGAALIADATDGRFILGLGFSHQPINQTLGIAMPQPLATLRRFVAEVQGWLRGEGPVAHLPQRPAAQPTPLYVAALGEHAVVLGASWPTGSCRCSGRWSASRKARRGLLVAGRGPADPLSADRD